MLDLISFPPASSVLAALDRSAPSISQSIMVVAAVIGLTLIVISRLRRSRKTTPSSADYLRELQEISRKESTSPVGDVEEVMVQLDEMARRIHGRLDMKLATLEMLIRDADQRIEKLSSVLQPHSPPPKVDVTIGAESPETEPKSRKAIDAVQASIFQLADGGYSALQIAKETGRTIGEVDLILALRRTREKSTNNVA